MTSGALAAPIDCACSSVRAKARANDRRSITASHFSGAHLAGMHSERRRCYVGADGRDVCCTNPPNLKHSPTIFSQEYSSKEKCEAARATLDAGFLAQVEALNRIMTEKFQMGEVRNYESIYLQISCTEK